MNTHGDADAATVGGNTAKPAAAERDSIGDWVTCSADPRYRAAVVDLLGALAYGELSAFERLAEDAKLAPELADKAALAGMAAAEFGHYRLLDDRLASIGADSAEAMRPFVEPLDEIGRASCRERV